MRQIAYATPDAVLGHFAYTLDARGNRIATTETLKSPSAGSTTLLSDDEAVDYYKGSWAASGAYMESTHFSAALRLAFFGDEITLTLGQDSDHGICDLYVNNVLWGSLDTYAPSAGDEAVTMYLDSDGPHVLDIRNRPDNHMSSTGYRLSFKQLVTNAQYDMHTVQYTYDGLSRLIAADYSEGENVDGTAFREYDFAYDLAGNRTQEVVEVNGTPTTTNYTYDAANRMTAVGAQSITYNNAGQMTDDGTLTYSWDRGGRLLSAGSSSYEYNGLGQRIQQTVSSVVTEYLLDVQPGLSKVLAATTGGNTTRYIHAVRGLHSQQQSNGNWVFPITDGLNSVRSVVDESFDVLHSQHYAPYGEPFGESGTVQTDFGFTGEPTDGNGLVHLRARYLNPSLGVFPSLDSVESCLSRLGSVNRYSYVNGNVVNAIDPSGMIWETPGRWNTCQTSGDCSCYFNPYYRALCEMGVIDCSTFVPTLPSGQPPSTSIPPSTGPCNMREANGVNALAWTAHLEISGGAFSESQDIAAAIMLAQLNFHVSNGRWNTQIGPIHTEGEYAGTQYVDLDQVDASSARQWIIDMSQLMVEAHCNSQKPLTYMTDKYPSIANDPRLDRIQSSDNNKAAYFSTMLTERLDCSTELECGLEVGGRPACILQDTLRFPLVIPIEGPSTRSLIVGDVNVSNPWVRHQCPLCEVEFINFDPSDVTLQPSDYNCGECPDENRVVWWCQRESPPRSCDSAPLSWTAFQLKYDSHGGAGYVHSCS